jgi:hypothetical protein
MTTTVARTAPQRHPGGPSRSERLASRTVAVCTALAIVVTLAVAAELASSAVARPVVVAHGPTINGTAEATADQPLKQSGGPRLSGLRESPDTAVAPSEEGGFPWGAAVIGGVALGLIGLAISRSRSRTRTGPAALSQ